ncbi:hypothetical protein [Rickettsia asembonensis]|uniref:hypothetical protein n=1 Tax=Rickettsia asembonensis TaxID=1068590 RepID=UPI0023F90026|nr:hypothetical protein [Rickettsia asembonensis]WCR55968.1 MAG: hypothetical protein PG979_000025 [Rickettsia asembonensis]
MFKITRAAKQIFNAARNIQQVASVSINSGLKYCTQSKGYIEDASEEFTFLKVLPSQSSKPSIQDTLKDFNPNLQHIAYVKSQESKEYVDDAVATYNITEDFRILKERGYDFAAVRKAIENQSLKSIFERMKELSISGYISNYAGDRHLREDIEKVSIQKELVINEFMNMCGVELEEHSSELLG